jgi:photosystem II stability/assembly factor-like uncharacterized protein
VMVASGLFGTLGPAGTVSAPAGAASPTSAWTTQANYQDGFQAYGLSCPTTAMCAAVGVTNGYTQGTIDVTTDGGSTWHEQPEPAGIGTLTRVSCVTSSNCMASGSSNIAYTTDGGAHWGSSFVPNVAVLDFACVSASDCVAVGSSTDHPAIAVSADGGATWQYATVPAGATHMTSVSCNPNAGCVAVGESPSNAPVIVTSSDGGKTWTTATPPAGLPSGTFYNGAACGAPSTCVVIGTGPTILWSADGGATWESASIPSSVSSLTSVSCGTSSACAAAGAASSGSVIISSDDGGQTWGAGTLPSGTQPVVGISCVSTSLCRGIASIHSQTIVSPPSFLTTTDGGATWTGQSLPRGVAPLGSISCPTAARCYASSDGDLLTTGNGGATRRHSTASRAVPASAGSQGIRRWSDRMPSAPMGG